MDLPPSTQKKGSPQGQARPRTSLGHGHAPQASPEGLLDSAPPSPGDSCLLWEALLILPQQGLQGL